MDKIRISVVSGAALLALTATASAGPMTVPSAQVISPPIQKATRLTSSTREPENFSLRPRQWRCARILSKVATGMLKPFGHQKKYWYGPNPPQLFVYHS